jgi:hypothetical protein
MDVEDDDDVIKDGGIFDERIIVENPPSATDVYQLFEYLTDDLIDAYVLDYWTIHQTVNDRCPPSVIKEVEKNNTNIRTINRTIVRRMVLEMLTTDEKGSKIKQILAQLEELYLLKEAPTQKNNSGDRLAIRGGKSNFINVDSVRRSTEKTHRESLLDKKDKFREKCLEPKKRGRHSTQVKANKPDRVDQIKSSHILSQKSVPPILYDEQSGNFFIHGGGTGVVGIQNTVDYYPIFLKILDTFNDCIPKGSNHGIYLEELEKMVRISTSDELPIHSLMKTVMNAERIFPIKKTRVPFQGGPYYCVYSGMILKPGEEVWHIRILENDGDRYKQWEVACKQPPCPPISPEFTRSMRAFFVKTKVTSLTTLSFAELKPLSPLEIVNHGRKIVKVTSRPIPQSLLSQPLPPSNTMISKLPTNRSLSVNTLWLLLNRLRNFIDEEGMGGDIWEEGCVVPYDVIISTQITQFSDVKDKNTLTCILFIATFGRDFDYSIGIEKMATNSDISGYVSLVRGALLDFIDLMFPFHQQPHHHNPSTQQITKQSFNLNTFEIQHCDENNGAIRPVIACPNSFLLAELFSLSHNRQEYRVSMGYKDEYKDRKERIENVEFYIIRHPFLFLPLFNMIFEPCYKTRKSSYQECKSVLHRMNLFINSKK